MRCKDNPLRKRGGTPLSKPMGTWASAVNHLLGKSAAVRRICFFRKS